MPAEVKDPPKPSGGPESQVERLASRMEEILRAQIPKEDFERVNAAVTEMRATVTAMQAQIRDRSASLPGADDGKPYSFSRVWLAVHEGRGPEDYKRLAPYEYELSVATRAAMRKRALEAGDDAVRATMSTTIDSEGGFLVPIEKLSTFYDVFWANLALEQLGVTKLTPKAPVNIVKLTGGTTAYDVHEGRITGLSHSNPTLGMLSLKHYKTACVCTQTQELLRMADPSIDTFLEAHMARTVAQHVEQRLLTGSGAQGQPRGLFIGDGAAAGAFPHLQGTLQQITDLALASGASTIGVRTTGAYRTILDYESALLDNKVLLGPQTKIFSHHAVRQAFRLDPANAGSLPLPLTNEALKAITGYDWVTSPLLPKTMEKSGHTGTGALAHFAMGNFEDFLVALFGGAIIKKSDVAYSPITAESAFFADLVHVMVTQLYDGGVIRKESIVGSNEVTYS